MYKLQESIYLINKMNRSLLDNMSVEELREEADRYNLTSTGDRLQLIDRIMTHLERHGPMQDTRSNTEENAAAGQIEREEAPLLPSDGGDEGPVTASGLRQVLATLTTDMLKHQKEMQQQQFQFMRELLLKI